MVHYSKYIKVKIHEPYRSSIQNPAVKSDQDAKTKEKASGNSDIKAQDNKNEKPAANCNGAVKVDRLVINVDTPAEKKKDEVLYQLFPKVYAMIFLPSMFFLCVLITVMFILRMQRTVYRSGETTVLVYDGEHKYMTWPDPPPRDDLASVARYVVHISEFGALATNSTHKGIKGYPFANIFSVSDGPFDNSTGVPYFYFTPLELSVQDIKANNQVSLTVSEAQSNYCNKKGYDPEDPRCAHIILTGSIQKIDKDSEEEKFAKNALFSRHVEMKNWPSEHDWFFAKLDIIHIYLLDYFGGVATVTPEDYYAANPFPKDSKGEKYD